MQGRLVRERYLSLRSSAVFLQRFFRSRFARKFFLAAREAVVPIQALVCAVLLLVLRTACRGNG